MRLLLASFMLLSALPWPNTQQSAPVPGKAAKSQHTETNGNKTASTPNKPPPVPISDENPVASDNSQKLGQTKIDKTEQKNISDTVFHKVNLQKDPWDYVYIGATLLLALLTLGIAWTALIQARAVQNAQRAWMVAKMEDLPPEYVPDQTLRMACHIKNMGKTPARLTEKGERRDLGGTLPETPRAYDNIVRWEKGVILPPNSEIVVILYLSAGETLQVYKGEQALWVHGFIEYKDVFGKRHRTRYCFRYYPGLRAKDPATVGFYPEGPVAYSEAT